MGARPSSNHFKLRRASHNCAQWPAKVGCLLKAIPLRNYVTREGQIGQSYNVDALFRIITRNLPRHSISRCQVEADFRRSASRQRNYGEYNQGSRRS